MYGEIFPSFEGRIDTKIETILNRKSLWDCWYLQFTLGPVGADHFHLKCFDVYVLNWTLEKHTLMTIFNCDSQERTPVQQLALCSFNPCFIVIYTSAILLISDSLRWYDGLGAECKPMYYFLRGESQALKNPYAEPQHALWRVDMQCDASPFSWRGWWNPQTNLSADCILTHTSIHITVTYVIFLIYTY